MINGDMALAGEMDLSSLMNPGIPSSCFMHPADFLKRKGVGVQKGLGNRGSSKLI